MNHLRSMDSCILLLVVTSEQEAAIELLFSQRKWRYIKPALTEAISSRLASLNSEIHLPHERRAQTIVGVDDLANELATDICRNIDFSTCTILEKNVQHENSEKDTPESKFDPVSVVVKQEDTATATSGSDTEIEIYDFASVIASHVKTDDDEAKVVDETGPYTEMEKSPSNSAGVTGNWTDIKLVEKTKRSKAAKFKMGSKKRYSSYTSDVRKLLRKKNTGGKKESSTNKSKPAKSEKCDRCPKCDKYFTHSQFTIHKTKDRCQLICCFCEKNFGDNFAKYNRHIRNVHTSADVTNLQGEDIDDSKQEEPSDRDSKDIPVSGAYCCSVCGTSYISLVRYTKHVEKGNCKQTCAECGKVYLNNPQNFLIHTRTHSKSLQFPCTDCPKSFVTQAKLQLHMKEHTGGVFTCGKCDMTFRFQSHLTYHWKVAHTSPKKYMCDLCGAVYKSQASLNYHTDTSHSEDRPYTCHVCAAKFKVKVTLKAHMNVHLDKKNYQCQTCYKQFKTKSLLSNHERRHSRQFTHTCDVCFKGFYDKRTLSEHKNTHSGDKPHKCRMCEYACASLSNLIKHNKIHECAQPMGASGSATSSIDWSKGPLHPGGSGVVGGGYQFPYT